MRPLETPVRVAMHGPATSRRSARAQRGFGVLQALLLVVLVGAAVVAGITLLRSSTPADQAAQQEQALRWADEALVAYAAEHARLPCPVSSPTAVATACVAPGEKGWLPLRGLEAVHPGGAGPTVPLRYVVYRGAGDGDLAVASNAFSPHTWERTAHNLAPVNGLDFCEKLADAARESATTPRSDRARTIDASGATINIAYGLIAAGPTPGDAGGRFDGLNQQPAAAIEAPSLGADSRYDDRTRVRDFAALAETLGCGFTDPANPDGVALAAVDMLALALDVSDEVAEQHEGNKEDTQLAVVMAGVSTAFAVINVALAGASIANSVSTLATATAQLSVAIASCVVLVGCGLIPPYTAAVTAAAVAIGLAATATGLAAAALIPTGIALDLTIQARDMAQQGLPSASMDISAATERACIGAEGGFVNVEADANGNLIPRVPPVFRPGLRQQRDATAAELADLRARLGVSRARLAELERIPSNLLIAYPPRPVRRQNESDTDWNARFRAWLATRAHYERLLAAKLAAIRSAMLARFNWDTEVQSVENAENEVASLRTSINHLVPRVAACDANPPPASDLVNTQRCTNQRRSLLGLSTCDASVLTAAQVADRQCLPWKEADRDAAIARRDAARAHWNAEEARAVGLEQPPIMNYITDSTFFPGIPDCFWVGLCNSLIYSGMNLSLEIATYANVFYRSMGEQEAVWLKIEELEEAERAYQTAQAQCDALRRIGPGGGASGAEQPPMWAGASAIMQAANCRGATGAITPVDCRSTP